VTTRVVILGILGMVAAIAASASAQAPQSEVRFVVPKAPLIVGIWKLNPEKSQNLQPRSADYIEIRQYRNGPDGFLIGLLISGDPRQGYHYLQFTAKSDGKDYPEYTDAMLADMIARGRETPRTYAETVVDEHTTDWTDKANGRVIGHGKKVISEDAKTLTVTVDGSSQVFVYDRQ
jgi:hypothetical protein